jgi:tRNA modification GTPase
VLTRVVSRAVEEGARLAVPGEFTLRAFLHGRIDLVQAEAVADLVDAMTPAQARLAFDQLQGTLTREITAAEGALFELTSRLEASLDFPDEGYEFVAARETAAALEAVCVRLDVLLSRAQAGRVVREGAQVAVVGSPNVGKSSLFNRLVGFDRAITTEHPGTTRDLVTERVDMGGVPVLLIDTAGIREVVEPVEKAGVERARGAAAVADVVVVVLDRSVPLTPADTALLRAADRRVPMIPVANKADLPAEWEPGALGVDALTVSAASGEGIDTLRHRIVERLGAVEVTPDAATITNMRHARLVEAARSALERAAGSARAGASEEFVLSDVHEALGALQEVSGARAPDAVLQEIFSRFCIGK